MSPILLHLVIIFLALGYAVGKCAEVGDRCNYQEWSKTVKPIRDAVLSGNSGSLKGLLTSLHEKFRDTDGYDSQVCQVYYDENSRDVYSYGLDCGPDNKCQCGFQLVGSPTKSYELALDPEAKGCRRKTGQQCSKFGFIPEEQNCLTSDVCSEGICKKADEATAPTKKMQKYPKVGDKCDHSSWGSLYKPYLDARDTAHSMEGFDSVESEIAEEKSTDLFRKLMNAMDANPDLYGDVCYTADHVLFCDENSKCACNKPYVPDPKTRLCRTATGDTCFMRCIHLQEDQCLSSDHCFTYDVYKGEAICYPKGVFPPRKNVGRRANPTSSANRLNIGQPLKFYIFCLEAITIITIFFLLCCQLSCYLCRRYWGIPRRPQRLPVHTSYRQNVDFA